MHKEQNVSLQTHNTFGIAVNAKEMISVSNENELLKVLKDYDPQDLFLLGGGSNLLLTQDVQKTVVKVDLKGIEVYQEKGDEITLKVGAGENWHEFVLYCVNNNWGGIENLSLIPGNVGTSPIQNIGAYGVEVKDVIVKVECLELTTGKHFEFDNKACEFGYRNSIFKNQWKGRFAITRVYFKLQKKNHQIKTAYGAIQTELNQLGIAQPTIRDVSKAVINIRQSKLPDPKEIGNSGSFFKNPVVSQERFEQLKKTHPTIAAYPNGNHVKIAAGWLIEKAGWKGYRNDNYGVHKNQALVLVNYGGAKGKDIKELASKIQSSIKETFNIDLEAEVNIL